MKTIFLGTPDIAVPFLELARAKTDLLTVVTNPDHPAGRGYELKASPVKAAALRHSLSVLQPEKAGDPSFLETLKRMAPEVGIVVAYGKLLPKALLQVPRLGFLNVHFSLLPAYRGAAPIQWALINGERETGVTLFWLDEGMDTGPILLQKKIAIETADDAESLRGKLVPLGVELLQEALALIAEKGRVEHPQVGFGSKAPILKKEDGSIIWSQPAERIFNQIRGMTPWPGAFTFAEGPGAQKHRLKILQAVPSQGAVSGEIGACVRLESGQGFEVKCGQDLLRVLQVQPEGKKPMSAWSYWQGARLQVGAKFG